jgi:spore coat polysaccharide biosynthesis protein SpsF
MRMVAIIQARMTSTRLPGKIMMDIAGRPLIDHVVKRAQQAQTLDLVTVATTDCLADDRVEQYCSEASIPCFRGSEEDVLDRYYRAALHFKADVIVRLTADCPLMDPAVVDQLVRTFRRGDYDYVSNTIEPTYPDGLDAEVFGRHALERTWREARLKSDRGHVTPYIRKHPELFRLKNVRYTEDLSAFRWTVDEPKDLELVRTVYSHFGLMPFGMPEVLEFLRKNPELGRLNAGIGRNEGYQKSLREDSLMAERETK